jgi:hypothetical protein
MDGLIAVCGLKAVEALPEIVPLLNHAAPCVISDACPTVEVLGGGQGAPRETLNKDEFRNFGGYWFLMTLQRPEKLCFAA